MSGCFAPAFSFARRLDGVSNVFAIAQRRLTQQTAIRAVHFDAVAGIGPRLLAADVEFHSAVDRRSAKIGSRLGRLVDRQWLGANRRRLFEPRWLEIFKQAFAPALSPITAFPIAAETASGVKEIRAVNPDHAGLQLCGDVQ